MTQPTETPRCREMMYEPPVTKPGPYTGELRRCNLPLDTPTGGLCEWCGLPERRHGSGSGNLTDLEMLAVHLTMQRNGLRQVHSQHPYVPALRCSIHGAATDRGEA